MIRNYISTLFVITLLFHSVHCFSYGFDKKNYTVNEEVNNSSFNPHSVKEVLFTPPNEITRVEAETFTRLIDPDGDIKSMSASNHSAGASVILPDAGDKLRISVEVLAGTYIVKARVRSGVYNSSGMDNPTYYWPNSYIFTVNDSLETFTGDVSTLSAKDPSYGGSYWGTMVSSQLSLKTGVNTVDIEIKGSYKGVDYIELVRIDEVPPVVDAGANKTIFLSQGSATLIGSATDTDGSIQTLLWTKQDGPAATLSGSNTSSLTVSNISVGIYTFRLTATDNSGLSSFDEVTLTVNENPKSLIEAETFTTLMDQDGDVKQMGVSYHSAGASVIMGDAGDKIRISFEGAAGNYVIKARVRSGAYNSSGFDHPTYYWPNGYVFTVNNSLETFVGDTSTLSAKDVSYGGSYWGTMNSREIILQSGVNTVDIEARGSYRGIDYIELVEVNRLTPTANAGPDRTLVLPWTSMMINGAGTDSDGTIVGYQWSKQSGPTVTLTGQNTSSLSLTNLVKGSYLFRLTVTDNSGGTSYDDVAVSVVDGPTSGIPNTFNYEPNYNGNISAIKWKTKAGTVAGEERMYAFKYDTLNRLKDAYYAEKGTTGFNKNVGQYNEENIKYDLNGNILKLKRFESAQVSKRVMDDIVYQYIGNQLKAVNDVAQSYEHYDNGFDDYGVKQDKNNPEYLYDENGNMKEDKNKKIKITYNILNLPDTIHFENNNYVKYVYTATGVKLAKKVFKNGSLTKTTLYNGDHVFEDNELKFITTEEGRVVPSTKPDKAGEFEYEYFLKDHLGNTRLVVNAAAGNKYEFKATMEDKDSVDNKQFVNLEQNKVTDVAYNHTTGGSKTTRLNPARGKIVGPGITLNVAPGDTIKMEVFAKYLDNDSTHTNVIENIASAVAGAYTLGMAEAQRQLVSNAFAGVPRLAFSSSNTAPRAYLNYIFFDKSMRMIQGKSGFRQITETAATAFEKLYLETVIEKEGYLYIYVANESSSDVNVFFDDLKVTQVEGPVRSHTDYYPFGLTIAGLSGESAGTNLNKYLYNGKELQDEEFAGVSLDWYDYQARYYDPIVGRWWSVDPAADLMRRHSPYNYCYDNPLRFIDPDGMKPDPFGSFNPFKHALTSLEKVYNAVAGKVSSTLNAVTPSFSISAGPEKPFVIGSKDDKREVGVSVVDEKPNNVKEQATANKIIEIKKEDLDGAIDALKAGDQSGNYKEKVEGNQGRELKDVHNALESYQEHSEEEPDNSNNQSTNNTSTGNNSTENSSQERIVEGSAQGPTLIIQKDGKNDTVRYEGKERK